jgi:hypothetical protein
MVHNISTIPRDWHDRDQVDEWDSTASVVDQRSLALFACVQHALEMCNSDVVGVLSLGTFHDVSVRTWQVHQHYAQGNL